MNRTPPFCTFSDAMRAFNRKERYWLTRHALLDGKPASGELSKRFIDAVLKGLSQIPGFLPEAPFQDAYWALDYHINWLYGAAVSYRNLQTMPLSNDADQNICVAKQAGSIKSDSDSHRITGNQQDFDFLLSFDESIICIEAKAGGAWSSQLTHKCLRLIDFCKFLAPLHPAIRIFFLITSPEEKPNVDKQFPIAPPANLNNGNLLIPHFYLEDFGQETHLKVQRCGADGKSAPEKVRNSWQVVKN